MIAGTVPYQHAGTPAWLIPARLPLWYMEAIVSMYTILASIGCGPHVSSSCGEEDTCASSYVGAAEGNKIPISLPPHKNSPSIRVPVQQKTNLEIWHEFVVLM